MFAISAVVLYVVFCVLAFGWRSWVQFRRSGTTGFRGISGRPGSLEWAAGVGFVVAMVAGLLAPVLQATDVVGPIDGLTHVWIQSVGVVLAVSGIAGTLYAQMDMGDSWRIGVDASETTPLVRTGVFGLVRNPIFTAMLTFAAGVVLMTPNLLALGAFAVLVATIELQVRVVEEPYLRRTHGDRYHRYCGAVGRFVPGVGRITGSRVR